MQSQSQRSWLILARGSMFACLFASLVVFAHHSTAPYDLIHGTIIEGSVTRFDLVNPHGNISLDVRGEDATEHWTVAIESDSSFMKINGNLFAGLRVITH